LTAIQTKIKFQGFWFESDRWNRNLWLAVARLDTSPVIVGSSAEPAQVVEHGRRHHPAAAQGGGEIR
jgi:hypothetical protein